MFGKGAGFVGDRGRSVDWPLRTTSAPQSQDQRHVQELSQRSTYSGFSFDADSARSLPDFDESDLEDSSYTSASNFAVVRRQAANPAPSMLLVSMLEHLCSLYETDQEKRNKLFKVICEHLTKMKIVSGVSWLDEFGSVREQYKKAFSNLVSAAVESIRTVPTDAVVPLPRPTTTADRIKLLFQDSSVFSPRPGPPHDAFQTFASRYANEFLELDRLGKGGFGRVFKVKNKLDGQEYAVKKIFLKESNMDVFFRIVREVKLLASLQHANVVRYHTAWMEYSNPILTSNHSSSTNLPVLETSYLQDIQNLRSSYLYADSSSIVFQESAASDSEATVLKRRSPLNESSDYNVSVESYLQDNHNWKLGSSDSDESLPEYQDKEDKTRLVGTEDGTASKDVTNRCEEVKQLDENDKECPVDTVESEKTSEKTTMLLDTIPWQTATKEEADNNSEKTSKLLDTIPWETSRKEDENSCQKTSKHLDTIPWETSRKEKNRPSEKASELQDTIPWETSRKEAENSSQKTSKHLDTIPWETSRKEEAEKNRLDEKESEHQDTIPWETSRNEGSNSNMLETSHLEDTIQWETPEREKEAKKKTELMEKLELKMHEAEKVVAEINERSPEAFKTREWGKPSREKTQNMVQESEQLSVVIPTLEGEASSKSQPDSEQSVTKKDSEMTSCYRESSLHTSLHTSVKSGTGFEEEIHFESSSFSSSVRLGHSLPGAVVPFTSTPKDSLDVPVRGNFTPLSSVKRQHSWDRGERNGHTETHVCGDRCKLRLKGLADCDLVAETSGVVLYIQMQLCQRSLRDWMVSRNAQAALLRDPFGFVSEDDNMRLFQEILQGVNYIHSQGLMHRDLKPPNIFLIGEDEHVCIGDFGLAREDLLDTQGSSPPLTPLEMPDVATGETTHTSGVGTCTYASPEQLKGTTYNSKSDMYSMGVILFELFHPFGTEMERAKSIQDVREGRVLPPVLVERWPRQCDFMQLLTSDDPKYRPSAKDILNSDLFHSKDEVIANLKAVVDKQSQEMEKLRRQLKEREDMLLQLRRDRSTH
ncbi:eukaryotic translation initiation factor 2-alpha kinase 1-like isoform X2 [Branchiostoma lanceolatum]|uniref:eukaryotic translation initiation factor 2-alpha kinase 1-like isoform X2 n=1 Tax=Branchiostoma lanceolatum TaxID=7740 RepID=UPI00345307A9